jgi:hypothetical protein
MSEISWDSPIRLAYHVTISQRRLQRKSRVGGSEHNKSCAFKDIVIMCFENFVRWVLVKYRGTSLFKHHESRGVGLQPVLKFQLNDSKCGIDAEDIILQY